MAHRLEFHLNLFCCVGPGMLVLGNQHHITWNQSWTFSPSPRTGAPPIGTGNDNVHQGGLLLGCKGTTVGKWILFWGDPHILLFHIKGLWVWLNEPLNLKWNAVSGIKGNHDGNLINQIDWLQRTSWPISMEPVLGGCSLARSSTGEGLCMPTTSVLLSRAYGQTA